MGDLPAAPLAAVMNTHAAATAAAAAAAAAAVAALASALTAALTAALTPLASGLPVARAPRLVAHERKVLDMACACTSTRQG